MSVDEVLLANLAFYAAFAERDMEAMQQLWAAHAEVACIHPGWPLLEGRQAVLASWERILANPESPTVRCVDASARLVGEMMAWVTCREAVPGGQMIATNLFVREEGHWRIVHHQAGPTPGQPSPDELREEWN
ncbi:MAG: nuclear transport factor 2 family protein [Myxococcales bacterium]|nr:nuclear transport factor 2 family protein [Myxococcales bacterium]